jgi:hypothetical protein
VNGMVLQDNTTIAIRDMLGHPELLPEQDETISLYPTTATTRLSDLQDLCARSRFAGFVQHSHISVLYGIEQLDQRPHPDPLLLSNTDYPVSPVGMAFAVCKSVPTFVRPIQDPKKGSLIQVGFEGLSGHTPTLTRQEFLDHDMCMGPRNRYVLRWLIAQITRKFQTTKQIRAALYKLLLPKCVESSPVFPGSVVQATPSKVAY